MCVSVGQEPSITVLYTLVRLVRPLLRGTAVWSNIIALQIFTVWGLCLLLGVHRVSRMRALRLDLQGLGFLFHWDLLN